MSNLKCTFIVTTASLCLLVSSGEQTAVAKKPTASETPTYFELQTKTHLQAYPDATVAPPNQMSDFNHPSVGSGTAIRVKGSEEFGDMRDVLGMTNRKR